LGKKENETAKKKKTPKIAIDWNRAARDTVSIATRGKRALLDITPRKRKKNGAGE